MHRYIDPRLNVRPGEDYRTYADRIAQFGAMGERDGSGPRSGELIDKRARELLARRGVERVTYRDYLAACAQAAAEIERSAR